MIEDVKEDTAEEKKVPSEARRQARRSLVGSTPLTVRHLELAMGRLSSQDRVDEDGRVPAAEFVVAVREVVREELDA